MQDPSNEEQIAYWDAVAFAHDCTLQPPLELLAAYLPKDAKILDFGCGYGRSLAALAALGFTDLTGFDPAPAMLERGRREHPGLDLRLLDAPALPVPDASLDAVLLIAVLTSVASDDGQRRILVELMRVLKPGGILVLCDFPLQADERNTERYAANLARYGRYGVFAVPNGGVMRHHDPAWLDALTAGFTRLDRFFFDAVTMYGHPAKAICLVARKPAESCQNRPATP
jgi:SAM-dependent methyltransferase